MLTGAHAAAFLSGLAWSGLDVARKSLARDLKPRIVATGLALGSAALFGVWAAISRSSMPGPGYLRPAAIAVVLAVGVQLLILESLRTADLSRTIPLLSFTPVATAVFGGLVLDERLAAGQWIGVSLVVLGSFGLGSGGIPRDRGSLAMLGAALLISAAAPFDKLAVDASSIPLHGFVQSCGSGLLLLAYLGLRGEWRDLRHAFERRPALIVAGFIALAAIGFQFTAYRGTMVGVVETIKRGVGLTAALLAGSFLFRERVSPRKVLAVALMACGVAAILLGGGS